MKKSELEEFLSKIDGDPHMKLSLANGYGCITEGDLERAVYTIDSKSITPTIILEG